MPDLSELFRSQPGWVVVSVVLIMAAAFVLRPVLTGRYGKGDDEDDPEPEPQRGAHAAPVEDHPQRVPDAGLGRTYGALQDALDSLHDVATREAARSDGYRRERDTARRERDALADALDRAAADLAECERRAVEQVRDAHRYVGRRRADDLRRRLDPPTDPRGRPATARDDRAV